MSLEKYRWDLVNCERCSMCKWVHPWSVKSHDRARVCPSMQEYLYDAYSAQGRFDVARALLEGEIELTDKVLEVIYACTLCGGCDVTCKFTRDMEPLEVLHELRKYAVEQGQGAAARPHAGGGQHPQERQPLASAQNAAGALGAQHESEGPE